MCESPTYRGKHGHFITLNCNKTHYNAQTFTALYLYLEGSGGGKHVFPIQNTHKTQGLGQNSTQGTEILAGRMKSLLSKTSQI